MRSRIFPLLGPKIYGNPTRYFRSPCLCFFSFLSHHVLFLFQQLYEKGARAFWIHNTGPIGCLPWFINKYPPNSDNADQNGCVKSFNEVVQEFNKQLKNRIKNLHYLRLDAVYIYVDIYSAKYSLINNAKDYGFLDPLGCCCGSGVVFCGEKKMLNGTEISEAACKNPSKYLSWDGLHNSEAANKIVANLIVNGSFSEPQVKINEACPFYEIET